MPKSRNQKANLRKREANQSSIHPLDAVIGSMTKESAEYREINQSRARGSYIDLDFIKKKAMNRHGASVARIFGILEYQGQELAQQILLMKAKNLPNELIIKRISEMLKSDKAAGQPRHKEEE